MKQKVVFFGTPEYVLPVLTAVAKVYEIAAVVTQEPAKAGRDQKLTYSPVDDWAHKHKVPKYYSSHNLLTENITADFAVLAAYGAILPAEIINFFPKGILNIHPSLLPRWRGASPVQATLAAGDTVAGSTIIRLDEKVDHGPVLGQFEEEIYSDERSDTLTQRLFEKSADFLLGLLPSYLTQELKPKEQDDSKATFTTLIKKGHGYVPWEAIRATLEGQTFKGEWQIPFIKDFTIQYTPTTIHQFIRAMHPWPGMWTQINVHGKAKRLKILSAHLEESTINHQSLVIDTVQLEGKNPAGWKEFKNAYQTHP